MHENLVVVIQAIVYAGPRLNSVETVECNASFRHLSLESWPKKLDTGRCTYAGCHIFWCLRITGIGLRCDLSKLS